MACERCFKNRALGGYIRARGCLGTCEWCRAADVRVVPNSALSEEFRRIVALYRPVPLDEGDSLAMLMDEDWQLFDESAWEDPCWASDLLEDILVADLFPKERDCAPDYTDTFARRPRELVEHWQDLMVAALEGEVGSTLWQDAEAEAPLSLQDRLRLAVDDLAEVLEPPGQFSRARVYSSIRYTRRFTLDEMRAPSAADARAGRANLDGQPVLYLATDARTAVAETRPWTGAAVEVARFALTRTVRVLDLVRRRSYPKSPFFDELIEWKLEIQSLFRQFAYEIARPVGSNDEGLYRPTQKLCEFLQACGVEGLIYPSTLARGRNLVLFDVAAAAPQDSECLRVGGVSYRIFPYNAAAPLVPQGEYDAVLLGEARDEETEL